MLPDFESLSLPDLCSALVAGEASNQSDDGQRAVVFVAKNRAKLAMKGITHEWPTAIDKVILQPKQFSCFDDPARWRDMEEAADANTLEPWAIRCRMNALDALSEMRPDPTMGATHYLTTKLLNTNPPSWVKRLRKTVTIDAHTFFVESV